MPSGTGSKVTRDPRGGRPGRVPVIGRPQKGGKEKEGVVVYGLWQCNHILRRVKRRIRQQRGVEYPSVIPPIGDGVDRGLLFMVLGILEEVALPQDRDSTRDLLDVTTLHLEVASEMLESYIAKYVPGARGMAKQEKLAPQPGTSVSNWTVQSAILRDSSQECSCRLEQRTGGRETSPEQRLRLRLAADSLLR